MAIVCKSAAEIDKMRASGRIVREVLSATAAAVAPGITTMDLERVADEKILDGFFEAGAMGHDVAQSDGLAKRGRNFEVEIGVDVAVEVELAFLQQRHVLGAALGVAWLDGDRGIGFVHRCRERIAIDGESAAGRGRAERQHDALRGARDAGHGQHEREQDVAHTKASARRRERIATWPYPSTAGER